MIGSEIGLLSECDYGNDGLRAQWNGIPTVFHLMAHITSVFKGKDLAEGHSKGCNLKVFQGNAVQVCELL